MGPTLGNILVSPFTWVRYFVHAYCVRRVTFACHILELEIIHARLIPPGTTSGYFDPEGCGLASQLQLLGESMDNKIIHGPWVLKDETILLLFVLLTCFV